MQTSRRILCGLTAASFIGSGCTKDSQTKDEVVTQTANGTVANSMSGDSADSRGQALVRVVNAAPDSKGLIVRSDETHMLPAVEFMKVTPYQAIDRNWVTFQVRGDLASDYAPLETNREVLTDGNRYSMIVLRDTDGMKYVTRVFRDDISGDATRAHIRVIHAAPGIEEVNVVARGGEKLFDGVNFKSEAGFKDISPWSGTLEFRSQDGNRVLLTMPSVDLQAGTSYTIVLTRDGKGKLQTFRFDDTQTP